MAQDVVLVEATSGVVEQIWSASTITLIDHHKTAIGSSSVVRGGGHSRGDPRFGWFCDLDQRRHFAWDYLFPHEPRPLLLGHIEDRDLWRFKPRYARDTGQRLQP